MGEQEVDLVEPMVRTLTAAVVLADPMALKLVEDAQAVEDWTPAVSTPVRGPSLGMGTASEVEPPVEAGIHLEEDSTAAASTVMAERTAMPDNNMAVTDTLADINLSTDLRRVTMGRAAPVEALISAEASRRILSTTTALKTRRLCPLKAASLAI